MDIKALWNKVFPKPVMQKRYVLAICGIAYLIAKWYVAHTPDPYDDKILEQVHTVALQIVADASPITVVEPAPENFNPNYGETE